MEHFKFLFLFFRNITKLEWVDLSKNYLSSLEGELPDATINSRLLYLDTSCNNLTSLPKSFVNFLRLDRFMASSNKISSLNNIISNKRKLVEIDLAKNRISQVGLVDVRV